jgi:proteasome lid subunit RPN8/RPN11
MTMSRPLLEIPGELYESLITDLAASGRGVKEAGAFLLGDLEPSREGQRRLVRSYLMYDQVAPLSSSQHAYVAFTAEEMARAWEHCYSVGMQVVADVHTHPLGPAQSKSDRAHPIVSIAGHVALIVPYFAMGSTRPQDLGVHVFGGQGRWASFFREEAAAAIQIT